ncbi:Type 1 glutamine amidotransferase-like domain-containing protein [Mucilaginibacter ginkgonis]|uniref:Type 1 glutamine amidotransferase-like domain-containing protein n=1 Tax=Mucilaginibacter ginkgonis TaxID=2682091 RepID=A0A7T7FAG3_9SPHI|nr:Type 1 glutamine amidotransferase-like domain-containing protein [Mucilaginibacter ginkgonis]QQL49773.1 Type 1 glutamine amidotransferase-like domain-containing protein [Mucilaginibacter ginkgonis]
MIKLLLTSSGVTTPAIKDELIRLLGKPIKESSALFIPTGVYPFVGGANYAWWPIEGEKRPALVGLGWKSMGLLEPTALESIDKDVWVQSVEQADALLVWGGDPLYLAYWFERSGLAAVLKSLNKDLVYVGVSAGSVAVCSTIGETYWDKRAGAGTPVSSEEVTFQTKKGAATANVIIAKGVGLTDFAIIPHYNNPDHTDACGENAELWAAKIPAKVYALSEHSAISVDTGKLEVVGDGDWKIFNEERSKSKRLVVVS